MPATLPVGARPARDSIAARGRSYSVQDRATASILVESNPAVFAMDAHTLWMVLATLLVLTGIAGMVLPALPGAPVVLGGLVLAAWADDFQYVGFFWITVLVVLTGLAMLVDFAAGA